MDLAASKPARPFVRDATGLVRQISSFDALAMALSGMGLLFVFNKVVFTPALYPAANPLAPSVFGFLVTLPIAGMYAMMSIAVARTGGDYVWVRRIIHPAVGFVVNFAMTILILSFTGTTAPAVVQWSFAETVYDLGILYHNQAYVNLANYLQQSAPTFWISVLIVTVTGLMVIASTRVSTLIVRYWTLLAFMIAGGFVLVILSVGNSGFVANFNAMSGTTYAAVVAQGHQIGARTGIPSLWTLDSLYAGAVVGSLGYSGFFLSSYFAGEVRQVSRTQIVALLGSPLIYGLLTGVVIYVAYLGEGSAFVSAMARLWITGSSKFPYFSIPSAAALSIFWTQNPVLVACFNLSYGATIIVMNIAYFLALSRNIFAWSFDRVLPSAFASLSDRTHTPVYAAGLEILVGISFVYVAVYRFGLLASYFSYGVAGIFIGYIFVALAGATFPFVRKDLFDQSDAIVRKKLGGVPLITVLSVLSMVVSAIVVYGVVRPTIGGVSFVVVLLEGIVPTFMIGTAIYILAYIFRLRQGLNLNLIRNELPPE